MTENKTPMNGMTVSTTQMNRAWERLSPRYQSGVNQNARNNDLAERVHAMGNPAKRADVLAQILSPSGKVHVHTDLPEHLNCFPQSVCWRFPEKVE